MPILIGLTQDHALSQLVELLVQLFEVFGHNLVRGLLHGAHLALPRLQVTESLIWLDNVKDERVALCLLCKRLLHLLPRLFLILVSLIGIAQAQAGLVAPPAAAFLAAKPTSAAPSVFITLINQVDVIHHERELGNTGIVELIFLSLGVGVAHNRDEHIEEDNKNESGRAEEENVDKDLLLF